MVSHLIEQDLTANSDIFDASFKTPGEWAKLKTRVAKVKLRWDDTLQQYVAP
jgi:hypothetical protein